MKTRSLRWQVLLGTASVILLTALSLVAVGALGGVRNAAGPGFLSPTRCAAPNLPGSVVSVHLANMGGRMLGRPYGMMNGAMRMTADRTTAASGTVSFLVTNVGTLSHELLILPLPGNQIPGARLIGGDGKIDESGSLGEAANTCGEGDGPGILPGSSSWVTVTLPPGRYELICNLPGHYAAGMYTQLTVN
jgi:uncharacterized cupredoxin-like copper-binding protein